MKFQAEACSAPSEALDVAPARLPIDIVAAHAILADGARRQADLGRPGWTAADFTALDAAAALGDLYLARLGGDAAACLILQRADPRFWGERPDDALYLHKLAVRHTFAGLGIGTLLIAWAEQQTRTVARAYLRLDCQYGNVALNRYYQAAGFVYRGMHIEAERVWSLYEKPVASGGASL